MAEGPMTAIQIEADLRNILFKEKPDVKKTILEPNAKVKTNKVKPNLYKNPHMRNKSDHGNLLNEDDCVISYESQHGNTVSPSITNLGGDSASNIANPIQAKKAKKKKKVKNPNDAEKKKDSSKEMDKILKKTSRGEKEPNTVNEVNPKSDEKNLKGAEEDNAICQDVMFQKEVVELFEKDFIFLLKKKSTKFPKAMFFCRLCDYHCFDIEHTKKHLKDTRHQRLKKMRVLDQLLHSLPPPEPPHIQKVTTLLMQVFNEQGLSENDVQKRKEIVTNVEKLLKEIDPDLMKLVMYGSSQTMLGLKSSDINMDFATDVPPALLKDAHIELSEDQKQENGYVTGVESDFSAKVPCVRFKIRNSGMKCQLGINNTGSHSTSTLLSLYGQIDPRVRSLAVAFRYLGRLCRFDSQAEGTLPAYVFSLMTVFFLQQCEPPVLPVLHELIAKSAKPGDEKLYFSDLENLKDQWTCRNHCSVGELWIRMLKFYSIEFDFNVHVISIRQLKPMTRQERKWASKKLAIEDPFINRRNVARTVSHTQVFEYVTERIRAAYQYFAVPQTSDGPLYRSLQDLKRYGKLKEAHPLDSLTNEKNQCRTETPTNKLEEALNKKAETSDIKPSPEKTMESFALEIVEVVIKRALNMLNSEANSTKSSDSSNVSVSLVDEKAAMTDLKEILQRDHPEFKFSSPMNGSPTECVNISHVNATNISTSDDLSEAIILPPEIGDLTFAFDETTLSDEKGPAIICSICQKEGHLKQVCPEELLPPPAPLPPITIPYRHSLEELLHRVPGDFEPTQRELEMRQNVVMELECAIRETYPDARLQLFGSSCNGFGFRGSDLDLCLTFENVSLPEEVDAVQVIEKLAKMMKKQRNLYNVFAITTAKVPIVKFKHRRSQLEGDISLYNTLAIENTRMLLTYSELDPRVKHLGYTMKVFAKICDICDASRGSLSSYAYILLVLYFLQQRTPPVIPVLQELNPDNTKKEKIIDGWNAWFYDNRKNIKHVWPDYGRNRESLVDLWIGMLRFYTEEFNFKDYIVSIRQKNPLTKFEKLWNNGTVAIEDPFDLSHNLGGGLSRKMNMFLIRTFRNARSVFGTSVHSVPNGYKFLQDYLFDPNILTDSSPPSDRNCHRCGKIGHFVKECPLFDMRRDEGLENSPDRDNGERYSPQKVRQPDVRNRGTPERTRSNPQPIPQSQSNRPVHRQMSPQYNHQPTHSPHNHRLPSHSPHYHRPMTNSPQYGNHFPPHFRQTQEMALYSPGNMQQVPTSAAYNEQYQSQVGNSPGRSTLMQSSPQQRRALLPTPLLQGSSMQVQYSLPNQHGSPTTSTMVQPQPNNPMWVSGYPREIRRGFVSSDNNTHANTQRIIPSHGNPKQRQAHFEHNHGNPGLSHGNAGQSHGYPVQNDGNPKQNCGNQGHFHGNLGSTSNQGPIYGNHRNMHGQIHNQGSMHGNHGNNIQIQGNQEKFSGNLGDIFVNQRQIHFTSAQGQINQESIRGQQDYPSPQGIRSQNENQRSRTEHSGQNRSNSSSGEATTLDLKGQHHPSYQNKAGPKQQYSTSNRAGKANSGRVHNKRAAKSSSSYPNYGAEENPLHGGHPRGGQQQQYRGSPR